MTTDTSSQDEAKKIWAQLEAEEGGKPLPATVANADAVDEKDTAQAVSDLPGEQQPDTAHDDAENDPIFLRQKIAGMESILTQLSGRLRNAEGHIGGMNSQLKQQLDAARATKAAGEQAPTAGEIQQAQASPQAMVDLERDYPEFAKALRPAIEATLTSRMSEFEKRMALTPAPAAPASDVVTRQELEEFRAKQTIEIKHPGWERKVAAPEFLGWLQSAPREQQMLSRSSDPLDAIRLLDLHQESRLKPPAPTSQRLSSAAAMPTGQRSAVRAKNVDEMSPQEYWRYQDQLDKDSQKD